MVLPTPYTLEALNGGQISNASFSSGNAGKIVIQANDNVTLVSQDPFYSQRLGDVIRAAKLS